MSGKEPIFTKKQVAEFNTSQDSLKQIVQMEWNVDELFRQVYSYGLDKNDIPLIKSLYHYLLYVYADRLYSIMWTVLQREADEKEKQIEKLYSDWISNSANKSKVPTTLLRELRTYKRWLYEQKQKVLRLGIPTKEESTGLDRLKKAAGV